MSCGREHQTERPLGEGSCFLFLSCFCDSASVRRAIRVALLVGPIIGLINHFDLFAGCELTRARLFKVGLTFLVPFCVSSYSSATTMMAKKIPIGLRSSGP